MPAAKRQRCCNPACGGLNPGHHRVSWFAALYSPKSIYIALESRLVQIRQPASIFPYSALRMVNGFILPFRAFSFLSSFCCQLVSTIRNAGSPLFPGAANAHLAAARAISMRVVDKAFQPGKPSGDVIEKNRFTIMPSSADLKTQNRSRTSFILCPQGHLNFVFLFVTK